MKAILRARDLSRGIGEQETAVERQAFSPDRLLLAPLLYFSLREKWSHGDLNPKFHHAMVA